MKKYLFVFLIQIHLLGSAQEEKKFGIELTGYVKTDISYDSRQTEDVREGYFLLYQKIELRDFDGNDINATPKFNILSIQTSLTGPISEPDFLGANDLINTARKVYARGANISNFRFLLGV